MTDNDHELVYQQQIFIKEGKDAFIENENQGRAISVEIDVNNTLKIKHIFYDDDGNQEPITRSEVHSIPETLAIKLRDYLNILYPKD